MRLIAISLVLALVTGACSGAVSIETTESPDASSVPGVLITSNVGRADPDAGASNVSAVATGMRAFAADLYGRLAPGDGNLVFSPVSVYVALAMTYAGAVGTRASNFPILKKGGCLRCVMPVPPDPEDLPTANDVGVLAAATAVAGARSSTLILRILTCDWPAPVWETFDVWTGTHSSMKLEDLKKHHGVEKCELCGI